MLYASTPLSGKPRWGRRQWLQYTALSGLGMGAPLRAQDPPVARKALTIAQVADISPPQQDVSHDFLIGSRAAWQAINAAGGLQGRPVHHLVLETDGSAASLQAAWHQAHAHPGCVALSGCVGHAAAAGLAALQTQAGTRTPLAQIAPWLRSRQDAFPNDVVFDIFPDVQAQIAHALKTMLMAGQRDVGVVYGNTPLQQQSQAEISRVAYAMGLRTHTLANGHPDRRTPPHTLVLFIGGTPELHAFTRQLVLPPGRQCYVVALADANLQVLAQLGGAPRNVSVIATQAVPLLTSSLPVVRAYRQTLARLYDEPPSPLGLAGFIAARYTADTLARIGTAPTRASVLEALRQHPDTDIGGFRVAFQGKKRTSAFVTQTLLTSDGRIVG
ncbi:MAG: ABC transporter substrate-binding protein [Simplicispira sp.]|nr:ABC transporter substrate-binding protein [Simplicispira sp.]